MLRKFAIVSKQTPSSIETSDGLREGFTHNGNKVFWDEGSLCMVLEDSSGDMSEISLQEWRTLLKE
jgi:hypothetical protein